MTDHRSRTAILAEFEALRAEVRRLPVAYGSDHYFEIASAPLPYAA